MYTAPKKGQTGNHIVALQRRLRTAGVLQTDGITGYFGDRTVKAVKKFQRKVGLEQSGKVGERTWNLLVAKTGKILIKKPFRWPPKNSVDLPSRCETSGRVLCVDTTRRKLYYVKAGTIIKTTDARFGCPGLSTRNGTFQVYRKSRNHASSQFGSSMPYAMFFSGGQAVHYSPRLRMDGLQRLQPRLRQHSRPEHDRLDLRPGPGRRPGRRLLELSPLLGGTVGL